MKEKKDDKPKKEEEIDYETLYYKAMKENVLLREKKISLEFTTEEINFLRETMFEELYDITQGAYYMGEPEEDEEEENKMLNRKLSDDLLRRLRTEQREIIETIIRKLRFEI